MHRSRSIVTALMVATACTPALGSVVCEFEPTLEFDDCRSCYKADQDGVRLYLDGKLRASSTSPLRAPTLPIDGRTYSRGVENTKISERSGRYRVFEYCYEKETPLVASSFELRMSQGDFEEFSMGGPAVKSGVSFVLSGKVTSGTASFFGDKLAFLPNDNWTGYAEIPYRVVMQDGRVSEPGVIIIKSPGYVDPEALVVTYDPNVVATPVPLPEPIAPADPAVEQAVLEAAAIEEQARLQAELDQLMSELDKEVAIGVSARQAIDQYDAQIADLEQRLELVNREIAKLEAVRRHLELVARHEVYTQPVDWVTQSARIEVLTVSSLLDTVPPSTGKLPTEPVEFVHREPGILNRVGPGLRLILQPAAGEPDNRNTSIPVLRPKVPCEQAPSRRRLTKADKKRMKKQRKPGKEKGPEVIRALERIAA